MAKYETIRKNFKTGDVMLFSGKGAISHGIKLLTCSNWSHVGMVLKLPETDTVFLWESTTLSNLADAIDGKKKKGVQLVLLSDRLRTYGGDASVRHLKDFTVDGDKYINLMKFRTEIRNKPYEKSEMELMRAAYDGPWGHNEEDLSSLFCSEMVAEAYQRLGLLPVKKPSNEYTPRDFSDEGKMQLITGSLGKEISVTL